MTDVCALSVYKGWPVYINTAYIWTYTAQIQCMEIPCTVSANPKCDAPRCNPCFQKLSKVSNVSFRAEKRPQDAPGQHVGSLCDAPRFDPCFQKLSKVSNVSSRDQKRPQDAPGQHMGSLCDAPRFDPCFQKLSKVSTASFRAEKRPQDAPGQHVGSLDVNLELCYIAHAHASASKTPAGRTRPTCGQP